MNPAVVLLAASMLDPLYNAFGSVLAAFFSVVPSYAFAIAMLTIAVRVALIPLTAKQVRSQQAMQRIQPEMKRLQAKHKGDRQKLNEEMMKLYKEHKANPLAGCLPLLLQAPLFFVLYQLILDLSDQPPKHLSASTELYAALVKSGGKLESLGIDLAEKAGSVPGGLVKALPFYVLVALVVATGYYQQRQMTARLPKDSINPQMQMVGKIFPAVFGIISLSVPAGVVVYFIVSNIWQIGQQAVAFRHQPPPLPAKTDGKGNAGAKTAPAGGGSSRAQAKGTGAKGTAAKGGQAKRGQATNGRGQRGQPGGRASGTGTGARAGSASGSRSGKGRRPAPAPRPKGLPPNPGRGATKKGK